jgi:protoheme IX farnesyltransferase
MIVAKGQELSLFVAIMIVIAVSLGSAGANVLTCYIDRDIDKIMERTSHRPLPSGRINPAKKALYYGLVLSILSILITLVINVFASIIMLIGILDNVLVYSKILKRRNPINIILGGFSGGLPVLVGYIAASGTINLEALLMAGLVVLWIPNHIWSLAIKWKEDYGRAKIPMLPVVTREVVAMRCIASTSILLAFFALIPYFLGIFSFIYFLFAFMLSAIMLILNIRLLIKPTKENSWIVFKFSSPFLALIFLAMMLDILF